MATTIASSFQEFRSNLEITTLQRATVSARQQNVRDAMARGFTVQTSFLTGSYVRSTMIAPLSKADVDIFVALNSTYYKVDGYASLLDSVRSTLLRTWPSSPRISRNGQAVTITFTDFKVDVVPAFHRLGGGYLIPSTTEHQWIATDPSVHVGFLANANQQHAYDLVPLIKMIKSWNREHGANFMSFYLELMVEKVLRGITISNFSSGCRYVFDKGRDAIRYKVIDPSGFGDQVGGLQGGTTVQQAVNKFDAAYRTALRAEQYATLGRISDAVSEWKQLFGGYFPAYG